MFPCFNEYLDTWHFITAVVDTRASHTCVCHDFVKLHAPSSEVVASRNFSAVDAQSRPFICEGKVNLSLQLPNTSFLVPQSWHILHDLPYDAVLGVDFLDCYAASVSLRVEVLSLHACIERNIYI